MKLTTTPQEFQISSLQLLRAYPASTKITTTYRASTSGKGILTLKTYDPVSGAVIKFNTTKIADVGRLIAGLHRLAREQTGAPAVVEKDTAMTEVAGVEAEVVAPATLAGSEMPVVKGKGKKKKGKKP